LSKDAQKRVFGGNAPAGGSGACGFKTTSGVWVQAGDGNGDGATKDDAQYVASNPEMNIWLPDGNGGVYNAGHPTGNWCCASCSWNAS